MKILLTGAGGQLGVALAQALPALGSTFSLARAQLDVADLDKLRTCIRETAPDVLVNAAAYTAVDKAEAEPELAERINAEAVRVMAEEMARRKGLLVHYSTDYVFDGKKRTPYTEDDPTAPLGAYGRSKLNGEVAIRSIGCAHLILRTAWVYSARGKNFLLTMLRLARERDELKVVNDQIGAPTWADWLAQVTPLLLERWLENVGPSRISSAYSQTYHLTAGGETSWYGFADEIFRRSGILPGRLNLVPIPSSDYPLPARRPAYSVLSNAKIIDAFGIGQTHWRDQLGGCLESTPL